VAAPRNSCVRLARICTRFFWLARSVDPKTGCNTDGSGGKCQPEFRGAATKFAWSDRVFDLNELPVSVNPPGRRQSADGIAPVSPAFRRIVRTAGWARNDRCRSASSFREAASRSRMAALLFQWCPSPKPHPTQLTTADALATGQATLGDCRQEGRPAGPSGHH